MAHCSKVFSQLKGANIEIDEFKLTDEAKLFFSELLTPMCLIANKYLVAIGVQ